MYQLTNWINAMMALTRPAGLRQVRVRLPREPAAAAQARAHVRDVVAGWSIPVDPHIAVLLTSDLVSSVITHGDGETVTLAVRCTSGRLRVDVYDGSRDPPAAGPVTPPAGLALVAALSTAWGCFRTPAGKAVYFTLAFQSDHPA